MKKLTLALAILLSCNAYSSSLHKTHDLLSLEEGAWVVDLEAKDAAADAYDAAKLALDTALAEEGNAVKIAATSLEEYKSALETLSSEASALETAVEEAEAAYKADDSEVNETAHKKAKEDLTDKNVAVEAKQAEVYTAQTAYDGLDLVVAEKEAAATKATEENKVVEAEKFSEFNTKVDVVEGGDYDSDAAEVVHRATQLNSDSIEGNSQKLNEHEVKIQSNADMIAEEATTNFQQSVDIAINAEKLVEHGETLEDHDVRITENKESIEVNSGRLDQHQEKLVSHDVRISENASGVSRNEASIMKNRDAISDNKANIAQNKEDIMDLRKGFEDMAKDYREFKSQTNGAIAGVAAMSQLGKPYGVGNMSLSVAAGHYAGENAIAIGAGYRPSEHLSIQAGVAANSGDNMEPVIAAGVTYEF